MTTLFLCFLVAVVALLAVLIFILSRQLTLLNKRIDLLSEDMKRSTGTMDLVLDQQERLFNLIERLSRRMSGSKGKKGKRQR